MRANGMPWAQNTKSAKPQHTGAGEYAGEKERKEEQNRERGRGLRNARKLVMLYEHGNSVAVAYGTGATRHKTGDSGCEQEQADHQQLRERQESRSTEELARKGERHASTDRATWPARPARREAARERKRSIS